MPYNSVKDLPAHIKKYPSKVQRMWMAVWNSTFKKTGSEVRAFKSANSVLKRNMNKKGIESYGHDAHMRYKIDKFLGRLIG